MNDKVCVCQEFCPPTATRNEQNTKYKEQIRNWHLLQTQHWRRLAVVAPQTGYYCAGLNGSSQDRFSQSGLQVSSGASTDSYLGCWGQWYNERVKGIWRTCVYFLGWTFVYWGPSLKTNKTKLCGLRSTRQGLEEGREQVEWRGDSWLRLKGPSLSAQWDCENELEGCGLSYGVPRED